MNRDPIGLLGGLNQYTYCCDMPLTELDPSGLKIILHWRANVPKDLHNQAEENLKKAVAELKAAGGLAADLAAILEESGKEINIYFDMNAKPMNRRLFGPGSNYIELNPQYPNFYRPGSLVPSEEEGATGSVVLGHEMGHLLFGFADPENVTLIENVIRKLLNPQNPILRPTYDNRPIPKLEDIPKMPFSTPEHKKGEFEMITKTEFIKRRLKQHLDPINKIKEEQRAKEEMRQSIEYWSRFFEEYPRAYGEAFSDEIELVWDHFYQGK